MTKSRFKDNEYIKTCISVSTASHAALNAAQMLVLSARNQHQLV